MELIKTGNFRLGRQIKGVGSTRAIIFETQLLVDARMHLEIASQDITYNDYYIEEEVYTIGSFIDENGNPLRGESYWRRI